MFDAGVNRDDFVKINDYGAVGVEVVMLGIGIHKIEHDQAVGLDDDFHQFPIGRSAIDGSLSVEVRVADAAGVEKIFVVSIAVEDIELERRNLEAVGGNVIELAIVGDMEVAFDDVLLRGVRDEVTAAGLGLAGKHGLNDTFEIHRFLLSHDKLKNFCR